MFLHLIVFCLLVSLQTLSAQVICSPDPYHNPNAQHDFEAEQEFVNSKRTIPMFEKQNFFTVSGDVRFNYANLYESINGNELRGQNGFARQDKSTGVITIDPPVGEPNGTGIPFSHNIFEVEFNLYIDYVCDRSWGVAWVQYDNDAGIGPNRKKCGDDPQGLYGSGCKNGLVLRKAYLGYNIFTDGCQRFDIEIGRRPMYSLFDSRVQFQSNFDGVVLKYAHKLPQYGDFYGFLGAFMVDERPAHYAWVTEIGVLNAYCSGVDLRYSYVDWYSLLHDGENRCGTRHPHGAKFQVSQATASYRFFPCWLGHTTKLYGAFLINTNAHNYREINLSANQNKGWYAGFIIGEVCHEGDFAIDINYQYVEAIAIPDADCSGIGRGGSNILGDTITANGRGFPNYKGWRFEGVYALTDNFSIDAIFEFSRQIVSTIRNQAKPDGPPAGTHAYQKFELALIYAF